MFIEFQVGNFRSFRDIQKLSMQAAPKRANDGGLEEENVFEHIGLRLLKTKAIYGSNASGKSNLAKAFQSFSKIVFRSVVEEDLTATVWEDRFQLITDWDNQPMFFQYVFSNHGIIYRYGFEILRGNISKEWLFGKQLYHSESQYFFRDESQLKIDDSNFIDGAIYMNLDFNSGHELFRPNALFLTAAALNGSKIASSIRKEIIASHIIDGSNYFLDSSKLIYEHSSSEEQTAIKQILSVADTGIKDLKIEQQASLEVDKHLILKNEKNKEGKVLVSYHAKYDEEGNLIEEISGQFEHWESKGTQKFLGLGALAYNSIKQANAIFIDEMDASLHPNLTLNIVQLFHSSITNPKNAQLIFITHDTSLLKRADLRRDQICFVNKDSYGISSLKTLIEYKGVRKDASYEKEYQNGVYDAVPFLGGLNEAFKQKGDYELY